MQNTVSRILKCNLTRPLKFRLMIWMNYCWGWEMLWLSFLCTVSVMKTEVHKSVKAFSGQKLRDRMMGSQKTENMLCGTQSRWQHWPPASLIDACRILMKWCYLKWCVRRLRLLCTLCVLGLGGNTTLDCKKQDANKTFLTWKILLVDLNMFVSGNRNCLLLGFDRVGQYIEISEIAQIRAAWIL